MLVLASGSAIRRRLLADVGLAFVIDSSDVDESARPGEEIVDRGRRLAREKALAVAKWHPESAVIGSDQVGWCDGRELTKCEDVASAAEQLGWMSGKTHTFLSCGALVVDGAVHEVEQQVDVTFRGLSHDEIQGYIAFGEWIGSAGSYTIEGRGGQLVEEVRGPLHAVLGLPLFPLLDVIRAEAATYTPGLLAAALASSQTP